MGSHVHMHTPTHTHTGHEVTQKHTRSPGPASPPRWGSHRGPTGRKGAAGRAGGGSPQGHSRPLPMGPQLGGSLSPQRGIHSADASAGGGQSSTGGCLLPRAPSGVQLPGSSSPDTPDRIRPVSRTAKPPGGHRKMLAPSSRLGCPRTTLRVPLPVTPQSSSCSLCFITVQLQNRGKQQQQS